MRKFVEIRSLNIKPGKRGEFQRLYVEKALPLLLKWKMDVVAFGPSLHDENTFYVIRAFESLEHRQKSEDEYYGSADWREGPREEMVALIESYIDAVIEMEGETIKALRKKATNSPLKTKNAIEIRAYNLKPGTQNEFHRLVLEKSLPMLKRWKVDVVTFGPSPHDENSYYLIRAYKSLQDRQASQDAFYGSDEWRKGPRDEIVGLIENYTTVVIDMDKEVINALRIKPIPYSPL